MKRKREILGKLFWSTLYLSAFTFGGGYVIVTLMKKKFVDSLHWIDEEEMLDLTAIAQSAPGAIAVNGAIVVGYKLAKIPGVGKVSVKKLEEMGLVTCGDVQKADLALLLKRFGKFGRVLWERIRRLETIWRESRDLAVLCERYYDRGYHCNVRYTV